MAKNNRDGNSHSFHLNNRSYDSILEEYLPDKTEDDKLINDIYIYIGGAIMLFVILYGILMMIRKGFKYYNKDEQIEQPVRSNLLLTRVSIIRRNSSIRNSLVPNRRSSLNIRFQMESRERPCNLRGYAVIRNNQQQEYQVDNTCLFSGDLQLVNSYSSTLLRTSVHNVIQGDNSTSKSIQFNGEEKGFYFYSLKTPYVLRPLSSIRLPFINIIPQCQFYYKAIVNIHNGQFQGVFQRYYDLMSNQFLPAGLLTIRDDQVLIGQSSLPDIPQNYTQTITIGQDHDVRYSIKSNLTSSNAIQTKDNSRSYELNITISNYKNKEIKGQLEFHGSNRIILHETTCSSGKMDGNMFILSVQLEQGGIYQCYFNVTLK